MAQTIALHEAQRKFIEEKPSARIRAAISGVRGGKTFVGVTAMALKLQEMKNKDVMIAAPSYKMLESVSKHEFLKIYGDNIDWPRKNERDRIYYDYGNNRIFFRSADDPNSIRGIGIDIALLDEASYMKKSFIDITMERVSDREGMIYITTTPVGNNWLRKEVWNRRNDPDVYCINWPSIANPKFPMKEWERLKAISDPLWFAQEYEGKFVGFGGAIFQYTYNPEVHVWDGFDYDPDRDIYCGMDFGINNPNFTTFAQVYEKETQDNERELFIGLFDELWLQGLNQFQVMERVIGKYNRKPRYIACDPSGKSRSTALGRSCVDIIRKDFGVTPRYKKDWNDWSVRMKAINELHKLLKTDKLFIHPRCTRIQEGFEGLSYPPNTGASILDEVYVKDGTNDHVMESIFYLTLSKPHLVADTEYINEDILKTDPHYYIPENVNKYTGFH